MPKPKRHSLVILSFEGCQLLDVAGPYEVFAQANKHLELAGRPTYYDLELRTCADSDSASSGFTLSGEGPYWERRRPIDTLVVVGGQGVGEACEDPRLVAWVRRRGSRAPRVISICSGTFLLAAAGLLDGHTVTTHWGRAEELATRHPQVRVEPDRIYTRSKDGRLWTSAGVTSGIDLAMAMVEEDVGRDIALAIARNLVVFMKRPGGQAQFSAQLTAQFAERDALRDLQALIVDHPERDHSVAQLASRVAMSPRNFARLFAKEVGVTPARFVLRARVDAARRQLEDSYADLESVAQACGFRSAEVMRRAFMRLLEVPPSEYRERFS